VLTVLPCDTPPALRVVAQNAGGGVVFNRTLTESQTIPIGGAVPLTLNVTVDHVNSETIVVEVRVQISSLVSIQSVGTRVALVSTWVLWVG